MNRAESNEPESDMKANTSQVGSEDGVLGKATPTTNHAASTPTPHWRRLARGRVGLALAGVLVGALLGAGTVAWQTDTLRSSEGARCWGSLTEQDLEGLPLGDEAVHAEEVSPQVAEESFEEKSGLCRLTGEDRESSTVTIRVHQPVDELSGPEARTTWPVAFLTSDMTPLGGQLTGMASPNKAWLALPQSCVETERFHTPVIVDVRNGHKRSGLFEEDENGIRGTLARVVVRAANGVMDELGCSGRFSEPDQPSSPSQGRESQSVKLCGLDDFTLPSTMRDTVDEGRVSPPEGPVRVCELGGRGREVGTKLLTITDPLLVPLLNASVKRPGEGIKGAHGSGSGSDSRAAFVTSCQSGDVGFLAQRRDDTYGEEPTDMRGMLERYADAQAESLGCEPPRMKTGSGD